MSDANSLALFGGKPICANSFTRYSVFDDSEKRAVERVMESGNLSLFIGSPGEGFEGGPEVRQFEQEFAHLIGAKYAVSVNSWTSGLWAIIGALDLEPGSEVLVSTWTMAATATTILHWGLIPVFIDIDPLTFNMSIEDVKSKTTNRSKALVSPDIFGLPADNSELRKHCRESGLIFVSDSAQAPLASDDQGNYTSSLSDIGGFSLNYHKHFHTGEGGVVVTNHSHLAERVKMLRNHGEVAVGLGDSFQKAQKGILGMNLRMGEIEAAIGRVQIKKAKSAVASRRNAAGNLISALRELPGLRAPHIPKGFTHSFYVAGFTLEYSKYPDMPPREKIVKALAAEGVPALMNGYQNIHLLPLFRKQQAIGNQGWPYSLLSQEKRLKLANQTLPVAEELHSVSFLGINMCAFEFNHEEIESISKAFHKVWSNLSKLRESL